MTYPLLLKPAIKDYLWGGTRLKDEFGYESNGITAEAWVLSCHRDGPSIVQNGELAGKTLEEALSIWGNSAIGKKASRFPYFPILIKLIDAKDRLSIQVHPDNDYAMRVEGGFGKTEMWYVVDSQPGAQLIYGFNKTISREEFRRRIEDNTITEVCNFVPVKKGDVFFIEAGTLHAIGAGILIAEVQQNSNTTYRVSDYGRLGADGKPRELHIGKAVDVTVTAPPTIPYGNIGETREIPGGHVRNLSSCEFFTTSVLTVTGRMAAGRQDSFCSLLCLEGICEIETDNGEKLTLQKGGSAFIPAGINVSLKGNPESPAELLYTYID
ncbi:MAG TPA: class I mannose-6-phosphate isomerase [Clostridiales bacterium]|nr:class I mannose-6-phosphate isomerase [Clostridiales bacterium]